MFKVFIEMVEIQLFYASVIVLVGGYFISPYLS